MTENPAKFEESLSQHRTSTIIGATARLFHDSFNVRNEDLVRLKRMMPKRPGFGISGTLIPIRTNHFKITVPQIKVFEYHVSISPEKCPRRTNRWVLDKIVSLNRQDFMDKRPVFDGRLSLFSIVKLADFLSYEFGDVEASHKRIFQVNIIFHSEIDFSMLNDALNGSITVPERALECINVITRHQFSLSLNPVGRSFFRPPPHPLSSRLGGGREVWFGFFQNVQPGFGSPMLNIDVTATAFYKPQSIFSFLSELLGTRSIDERFMLCDTDRNKLLFEIKGLKVEVVIPGHNMRRRYRVCNVVRRSPEMMTFPFTDKDGVMTDIKISEYFYRKYSYALKYPWLPCIQVGKEVNQTFIPLELCFIVPGQRCLKKLSDNQTSSMIKVTAKSAPMRAGEICDLIYENDPNDDEYLKSFGLKVDTRMIQFSARLLQPPRLEYQKQNEQSPNIVVPIRGVWDMRGKKFFFGVTVNVVGIINFTNAKSDPENSINQQIAKFYDHLKSVSYEAGMLFPDVFCFLHNTNRSETVENVVNRLYSDHPGLELLICILPGKTTAYAEIKRLGDISYGFATQCVQFKNVQKCSLQTLSNLCLKINVKLGGINNILHFPLSRRPDFMNEPFMFLGADITHCNSGEKNRPSITSLVASVDAFPSRYTSVVSSQITKQEHIVDLSEMMLIMLQRFSSTLKTMPQKLILYRDGISEGQFHKILFLEVAAIREACARFDRDYCPGLTYITIQKRHHTRLFSIPENSDANLGMAGNVPAGTIVDNHITNPAEFDFFLCSHAGIQGTSRPSHYYVLLDDNHFTADQLQNITYQLCHTYARCTRSVSVPAPSFYAHLVAMRARHYNVEKDYNIESFDPDSTLSASVNLHDKLKGVMYFA